MCVGEIPHKAWHNSEDGGLVFPTLNIQGLGVNCIAFRGGVFNHIMREYLEVCN